MYWNESLALIRKALRRRRDSTHRSFTIDEILGIKTHTWLTLRTDRKDPRGRDTFEDGLASVAVDITATYDRTSERLNDWTLLRVWRLIAAPLTQLVPSSLKSCEKRALCCWPSLENIRRRSWWGKDLRRHNRTSRGRVKDVHYWTWRRECRGNKLIHICEKLNAALFIQSTQTVLGHVCFFSRLCVDADDISNNPVLRL